MARASLHHPLLLFFLLLGFLVPYGIHAQEPGPSFSDVPPEHADFAAVEYLKAEGIVQGYEDGTFRPDQLVTRDAAVKVIVAPRVPAEELAAFTTAVYDDVPAGSWSLSFIEAARQKLGIIDGPPKKTSFRPADPVRKVEFIAMLLRANGVDGPAACGIDQPFSEDTKVEEWYYPYLCAAQKFSMTAADEQGRLHPAKELTRGEVAVLFHRFLMYQAKRRTQALLFSAEQGIIRLLAALDENKITEAEYASVGALLAARGAEESRPDIPLVQAALKVTEAFRALVRAYRAGVSLDFDGVVTLAGNAYRLADEALALSPDLKAITEQVKGSAQGMAESARTLKAKQ